MPKAVDDCVSSLLAKWKSDPSSRPDPKEEGQSAKSQAWAICNAAHKKDNLQARPISSILAEGEFHLEEVEGKLRLRVPMLREGKFRHPWYGKLVFDEKFFEEVIKNFNEGIVGYDISLNARHSSELGALAWFYELVKEDKQLFGLANPTPAGIEVIKNKTYRYASAEIQIEWVDPETGEEYGPTLLGCAATNNPFINRQGELTFFSMDEGGPPGGLYVFGGIQGMSENTNPTPDTDNEVIELQQKLDAALAEATRLQADADRVVALESQVQAGAEEIVRLSESLFSQKVQAVLVAAGAKRTDGKSISPAILNWAEKVFAFGDLGEDDNIIKLESGNYREYWFAAVSELLNVVEPTVPVESGTEGDEQRLDTDGTKTREEQEYDAGKEALAAPERGELFGEE